MDTLRKLARVGESRTNICRNLHLLLKKSNVMFPALVSTVPVTIRIKKPTPGNQVVEWPVIKLSSWVAALAKGEASRYLLAGFRLEEVDQWKAIFASFWSTYATVDADHEMFSANLDPCFTIPYALHGDEGKGLRGKAFLVESWQTIIGVHGPSQTNESGYLWLALEA